VVARKHAPARSFCTLCGTALRSTDCIDASSALLAEFVGTTGAAVFDAGREELGVAADNVARVDVEEGPMHEFLRGQLRS
jgi:hypothetical protein